MGEMTRHIVKPGARVHVLDWMAVEGPRGMVTVSRCSEAMCEMNFVAAEKIERVGLDPAKYVPQATLSRSTSKEEGNG